METKTRNNNRRGGLSPTLKPMRMSDTPGILRNNTRFKTVLQLLFMVTLCMTLVHTPFHGSAKQQLKKLFRFNDPNRKLIVDTCEWVTPEHVVVPEDGDLDLFATLLVSYPGAAKRAAYMQLEGLTQLLTGDDWFLTDHGTEIYAFYKSQYPHHEGQWSWGNRAMQSVYVLQNPRTALQTYMFLASEIKFSQGWATSFANLDRTFTLRPDVTEWLLWRNVRFDTEIHYWRWHIDYWMEQGLLRDAFTHDLTSNEHFQKLMDRSLFTTAELIAYQANIGVVPEKHDSHCSTDMISCRPVLFVSYEHIIDQTTGLDEVAKLASVIQNKEGIEVIPEKNRECVWNEIVTGRITGVRDDRDRDSDDGPSLEEYEFTLKQMETIIEQLKIVRDQYSSDEWSDIPQAQQLVGYVEEYITENELFVAANYPLTP